ncbi:DUF3891 family protein [Bacillus piscicola]|uniref:DUF3891 family protein n=1 Tax=Bacillus piscicola TaxID=1632684 RepID=UPI001F09FD6E
MIVNDRGSNMELIPQHEHARIAFEIGTVLADDTRKHHPKWQPLLTAIREHDRAWIPLDKNPILNEETNMPYAFTNYPETEKLNAYRRGIQETTDIHLYSGLLSSLHYASFFTSSTTAEGKQFLAEESKRQQQMKQELDDMSQAATHLDILQFCDDLSLYACMNVPGVQKEEEVSWFRNGFQYQFDFLENEFIYPQFVSDKNIMLTPFPLTETLTVHIHGTRVSKKDVAAKPAEAFTQCGEKFVRTVSFIPPAI